MKAKWKRTENGIRTGISADVDRLGSNTTIHLDVLLREPFTQFGDLGHTAIEEFLASPPCHSQSYHTDASGAELG